MGMSTRAIAREIEVVECDFDLCNMSTTEFANIAGLGAHVTATGWLQLQYDNSAFHFCEAVHMREWAKESIE